MCIRDSRYNNSAASQWFNGNISNVRIVKGTAVYTLSFRPLTEPLTNVTNTKLLCCNNSSVTGSTVTPGTITANSNPAASTDSPFDDPEGFQFGEGGDQNLIKCGTYNGVPGYPVNFKVEIGWEPQFFMVKNVGSGTNEWLMWDSMRGVVSQIDPNTGGNDARLSPTELAAEYSGDDQIEFHPTGVRVTTNDGRVNGGTGAKLIYIAIRRPDGYVGKPAEAGTGAFAMDTGNSSSTQAFDSGFPIGLGIFKEPASTGSWYTTARLTQGRQLYTDLSSNEGSASNNTFDSNTGWNKNSGLNTTWQSWMWKRGLGFDVVTYTGTGDNSNSGPNSTSQIISHNLGRVPEMIWVKCRSTGYNWYVYHSGQNGGTNPWNYYLRLNHTDAEQESVAPYTNAVWNNTAPTSTQFSVGPGNDINDSNQTFVAYLFASVAGISKVGSYTGSDSAQTITTGFSPRFVIIKNVTRSGNGWITFDTNRGWGAGNDKYLYFNSNAAQNGSWDWGAPTSTGFTLTSVNSEYNDGRYNYIYYAHA